MNHITRGDSVVNLCTLAFDKVNRYVLFLKWI